MMTEYKIDQNEQNVKKGIELSRRNKYKEALEYLNEQSVQRNYAAASHFAVCTVLADCEKAVEICRESLKKEDHNPEIYLNIGRLYNMISRRDLAYRALNQGLKISPAHPAIMRELIRMGQRRQPVFGFLGRNSIINKIIGFLTSP